MSTNSRTLKSNQGLICKKADAAVNRQLIACVGSDAAHVAVANGADDVPLGVIVDGADAAEELLSIDLFGKGETKMVKLTSTCSKGDKLVPAIDGSGTCKVLPTAAGSYFVIGEALEDGAADQEIAVKDCIPYLVVVQNHMADVAAAAGNCQGGSSPTATQVDSAIATAVAPLVTGINAILVKLETAAIVKSS